MESLISRMNALHRNLRLSPPILGGDHRLAAVVASCLQELHGIAARSTEAAGAAKPQLRLVKTPPRD